MIKELEENLLKKVFYLSLSNKKVILDAVAFAKNAHKGQLRKTGEAFVSHPLNVAIMLAEQKFDFETIIGAILHDTIEDTEINYSDIENRYGRKIAEIVNGVTKISNIEIKEKSLDFESDDFYENQVDTYRKLLLATAKDTRVIIIKIFDRYHNIQTYRWLRDPKKRKFYARETIEIYAKIAERIGIGKIKSELEELSFPYAYPKEYKEFKEKLKYLRIQKDLVEQKIKEIKKELNNQGIKFTNIYGRIKHSYSTYRKLKFVYNWHTERFYDLYAIRIILPTVEDCYRALGIIHSIYTPIPGTFDDFIAKPRENGYQSLHTAVRDKLNESFEVQFRTLQMHEVAEYGMAAHWHYKDLVNTKNEHALKVSQKEWIKELKNLHKLDDKKQFVTHLKDDLFAEKIFVFTPKGLIINLPVGSTPVDFAYAIHEAVGNRCSGAKIQGRMIPMDSKLQNGDIVEIITSSKARPSIDWLSMTKTSSAKQKIRHFLREANRDFNIVAGRRIINSAIEEFKLTTLDDKIMENRIRDSRMPYNNLNDAFIAIAEKILTKNAFLKIVYPNFSTSETKEKKTDKKISGIDSLKGIRYSYAGCCNPEGYKDTVGYIGRDHVIKIHKNSCKHLKKADKNRIIEI